MHLHLATSDQICSHNLMMRLHIKRIASRAKEKIERQYERKFIARLAQSAERKALNLVVVGLSPTVGVFAVEIL